MNTDKDLIEKFGDSPSQESFEQIVNRHHALVLRTCLRILGHREDAEDAVQTTFLVLFQKPNALGGPLAGWLHKTARDTACDMVRARVRRARFEQELTLMRIKEDGQQAVELTEELDAAIACLPDSMREAVILRLLENWTLEEAAQIAGCTVQTVHNRCKEGLERLRKILSRRTGKAVSMVALTAVLAHEASTNGPTMALEKLQLATLLNLEPTSRVAMLAKEMLKGMFWANAKVKMFSAVFGAVFVVLAIPIGVELTKKAEPLSRVSAPTTSTKPSKPGKWIVGEPEVVVSKNERDRKGVPNIGQGLVALIKPRQDYEYLTCNGNSFTMTHGPLAHPLASDVRKEIPIQKLPRNLYLDQPLVYRDPVNGITLLVTRNCRYAGKDWFQGVYCTLSLSKSMDDGRSWSYLGEIISSPVTYESWWDNWRHKVNGKNYGANFEGFMSMIGLGLFTKQDAGIRYLYLYFYDPQTLDPHRSNDHVAVARTPLDDVLQSAKTDRLTRWTKYYRGQWQEPGLGGRSSRLTDPMPGQWISYNDYLKKYLMMTVGYECQDLYLSSSVDGLQWSKLVKIYKFDKKIGNLVAVGLGSDPMKMGREFYLYYADKFSVGEDWQGDVVRRLIKYQE